MTRQAIQTDEEFSTSSSPTTLATPATLTSPHRFDGPHLFFDRLIDFDDCDETDHHGKTFSMNWKSRLIWCCDPRQWVRAILRLHDTPHSIALGTAVGVFVGLTPTFGIQMLLVLAIAFLARPFFRFNRFAALVAVYISNPFTMVPVYWFNYQVGTVFTHTKITWTEFVRLFHYSGYTEWWSTITNVFHTLGTPLILGSFLVATFLSLPTYPLMFRLSERVQTRREARKRHRDQGLSAAASAPAVAELETSSIH